MTPARGRWVGWAALMLLALMAMGCSTLQYYGHALWGGAQVLLKRRPVARVLADPTTPPELAEKLRLAVAAREFASRRLLLPDNTSYRSYADLGRPYAVWNVVAAPELSLAPIEWCFPIAGCVAYRGYFSERRARRFAAGLAKRGYDVDVGGVAAYSTLGWFADPLLNTFVTWPAPELAGLIFHELAHQRVYAKGDTTLNESFATAVEIEGVSRWLIDRGEPEAIGGYRLARERERQVTELLLAARLRLEEVYSEARPEDWKRRRKTDVLAKIQEEYAALKASWGGDRRFDEWFAGGLDNADLATIGAYHDLVPAFRALLARLDGDLGSFYAEVERVTEMAPAARSAALAELASAAAPGRGREPPPGASTSAAQDLLELP